MTVAGWRKRSTDSPEQFRAAFLDHVRGRFPEYEYICGAEHEVVVRASDEDKANFWLGNAYNDYVAQPERQNDVIARFAGALEMMDESFRDADPDIRARRLLFLVRPAGLLEQGGGSEDWVWRPFVADLVLILAERVGSSTAYLMKDDLVSFPSLDDVWEHAAKNLSRRVADIVATEVHPELYSIWLKDSDDAPSLLVLDTFWDEHGHLFDGDALVLFTARSEALVTKVSEDRADWMAQAGAQLVAGTLSPQPFVRRTSGEWLPAFNQ